MQTGIRDHLEKLKKEDKIVTITDEVDLRFVSAIIARQEKVVIFSRPKGYTNQVLVGGIYGDRDLTALAYGCPYEETWKKVDRAKKYPEKPVMLDEEPEWEVVQQGEEVNLASLPLPVLAKRDGAPYISAAITGSYDPDYGYNWGVYRYQLLNRNSLAVDLTTQNNAHNALKKAYKDCRSFGVTVNIGNHPYEFLASAMDLPPGVDEMSVAGGLREEPVELIAGNSVEARAIANSEYVLEGEFLPGGWNHKEGRFGEFHGLMGSVHNNPVLRVNRLFRRKNAHLYTLQMPGEIYYMHKPIVQRAAREILTAAGIEPVEINVPIGGCTSFHIIASIKKFPGAGKNAIAALTNAGIAKHIVITDDDIDVFDLEEVEWAIATRVQVENDIMIMPNMGRAKPLDPIIPPDMDPMLITRLGIDATMPEGIPKWRYQRIKYPNYEDFESKISSGVEISSLGEEEEKADKTVEDLSEEMFDYLASNEPLYYFDILDYYSNIPHKTVVESFSLLEEEKKLKRDEQGRYLLNQGDDS